MVDTGFESVSRCYAMEQHRELAHREANLRAILQNHLLSSFNNRGVYKPRIGSPARVAIDITVIEEDLRLARYGMARHRHFLPTKS